MPSFIDVANGAGADASTIQQVVDALKGTAGKGVPLSPTAVNDAINFALAVKNNDAGASKAAVFYKADGSVLLQIDKNGVIASPDGVVGAAPVATTTGTQTLTNKTLTSPTVTGTVAGGAIYTAPHLTTPVVDSGGLTVTAGGLAVTAGGISLTAGNMALTTGQYIGNGAARFRAKDLGAVANGVGVQVEDVAGSLGLLIVVYGAGFSAGFVLQGGAHTTALLFGPGAQFTNTFNNAGTVNVYWNGAAYSLQNNTGGSNGFQTFLFSNS